MINSKYNFLYILKWECIQVFFFAIFLLLLFFPEIEIANSIGGNSPQFYEIRRFLNALQFFLLPDCFFFLFFPLMLISISLIIFKKWRWFFLALTGTMLSMLLIADRIYYSFFTSVITTESFLITGQAWDVKSAIFEAITITDIFNISAFVTFVLFGIVYNKKIRMSLTESKITFTLDKIMGILFCLLAIYCYNIAFYIPKRYVKITPDHEMIVSEKKIRTENKMSFKPNYAASDSTFAATFGIINFHIKNFTDAIKEQLMKNEYKKVGPPEHLYSFFDRKRKINKTKSPFYGIANGRNVFLIHFESLHPIIIGLNINSIPITPTLNNLKQKNLYWDHILDQVTIGGSSDAEFETLTGMLPSTRQISAFHTSCMSHIPSLPRALKYSGYQTISLHGNVPSFWNRNISQPLLGFETMYFKKSFNCKTKIGLGISDKEFFSQSIDLLMNHQPPFFVFLMTLSSHIPYTDLPKEYNQLFDQTIEPDSMLNHYFQAIRYSDDALGEFFAKIKNLGLWENSIFVIYGDHQPGTNKRMIKDLIKTTGKSLYSPRFSCVPIMIVIPGQESLILKYKNQYQNTVGGLYDIFPTIMHLLGHDLPFGVFGSHLFVPNIKRDPIPFFRFPDSFVFNGIQYREQGNRISEDDMGIVFTNNEEAVIKSKSKRFKLYKKALMATGYCNYVINSDTDIASLRP